MRDRKGFLQRIQESSDGTKRKWVIAGSVAAIAVVLLLWIQYVSVLIRPQEAASQVAGDGRGFSFLTTLRAGAALIYESVVDAVPRFFEVFNRQKDYIIRPSP